MQCNVYLVEWLKLVSALIESANTVMIRFCMVLLERRGGWNLDAVTDSMEEWKRVISVLRIRMNSDATGK